jgi:hypothetical protein
VITERNHWQQADFSVQISPFRAKPFLFLALHSRSGMATLKNAGLFLLAELGRAGRKFPEWDRWK